MRWLWRQRELTVAAAAAVYTGIHCILRAARCVDGGGVRGCRAHGRAGHGHRGLRPAGEQQHQRAPLASLELLTCARHSVGDGRARERQRGGRAGRVQHAAGRQRDRPRAEGWGGRLPAALQCAASAASRPLVVALPAVALTAALPRAVTFSGFEYMVAIGGENIYVIKRNVQ